MSEVNGFLHLLRAEPSLLSPAGDTSPQAMDHRAAHEAHPCLRCGRPARCALIAETSLGPRWLDLCHACVSWVRSPEADVWLPSRPADRKSSGE
jgi:hypothetical protein